MLFRSGCISLTLISALAAGIMLQLDVFSKMLKTQQYAADAVADAQGRNRADATWYLNAKDLVPVGTVPGGSGTGAGKPQDKQPEKKA